MQQTDWTSHPTVVGVLTCVVAVIERDPPAGRTFAARRVWTMTAWGRPGEVAALHVHSLTAHTRWHPRDVRRTLDAAALDWIARTGGCVPSLQELADAARA